MSMAFVCTHWVRSPPWRSSCPVWFCGLGGKSYVGSGEIRRPAGLCSVAISETSAEPAGLSAPARGVVSQPVTVFEDQDRELVRRAVGGELEAFDELVRKHQRPLFGYVYRMCGNRADAEEVVQQALIRAWQGLAGFRGQSSFKTWLYRIATNLCINRVTRRKPLVELPEELPAPKSDEPAAAHRQRVVDELVQHALEQLPKDQRAALVMVTYDDMSYQEIAHALGKTAKAVDSLLVRARRNLRKLLEPARAKGQV